MVDGNFAKAHGAGSDYGVGLRAEFCLHGRVDRSSRRFVNQDVQTRSAEQGKTPGVLTHHETDVVDVVIRFGAGAGERWRHEQRTADAVLVHGRQRAA